MDEVKDRLNANGLWPLWRPAAEALLARALALNRMIDG